MIRERLARMFAIARRDATVDHKVTDRRLAEIRARKAQIPAEMARVEDVTIRARQVREGLRRQRSEGFTEAVQAVYRRRSG